tara:strand:+ start:36 stop:794 length:759 start_codon:yes stop_codon:yes gene_type:complete
MVKEYFFLVGLPRAGNTLLGSLINQNTNVCLTGNSVLMDVLWQLDDIKRNNHYYKNFPDKKSFNNITKSIFKNYYSDYKANKIIDRGTWGVKENLSLIKQNVVKKPKFIILYRPILECLASFSKAGYDTDDWADYYMDKNGGLLQMGLSGITNILANKEEHIFIHYADLVSNPIETIKRIFSFIGEDYIPIKTKDFEQFKANNTSYNDTTLVAPLHTIRTKEIKYTEIDITKYLSKRTIFKYKDNDIYGRLQ